MLSAFAVCCCLSAAVYMSSVHDDTTIVLDSVFISISYFGRNSLEKSKFSTILKPFAGENVFEFCARNTTNLLLQFHYFSTVFFLCLFVIQTKTNRSRNMCVVDIIHMCVHRHSSSDRMHTICTQQSLHSVKKKTYVLLVPQPKRNASLERYIRNEIHINTEITLVVNIAMYEYLWRNESTCINRTLLFVFHLIFFIQIEGIVC